MITVGLDAAECWSLDSWPGERAQELFVIYKINVLIAVDIEDLTFDEHTSTLTACTSLEVGEVSQVAAYLPK